MSFGQEWQAHFVSRPEVYDLEQLLYEVNFNGLRVLADLVDAGPRQAGGLEEHAGSRRGSSRKDLSSTSFVLTTAAVSKRLAIAMRLFGAPAVPPVCLCPV